jgi:endoglucanase
MSAAGATPAQDDQDQAPVDSAADRVAEPLPFVADAASPLAPPRLDAYGAVVTSTPSPSTPSATPATRELEQRNQSGIPVTTGARVDPSPERLYVVTKPSVGSVATTKSVTTSSPTAPNQPPVAKQPELLRSPSGSRSSSVASQGPGFFITPEKTSTGGQASTARTSRQHTPAAARIATADNPCGCPGYLPWDLAVRIGLYEVTPGLGTSSKVSMDHYFVSWLDPNSILQQDFNQAASRGHTPLVTVEPYSKSSLSSQSLLTDIRDGKYDKNIQDVCSVVAQYGRPVLIRWGHEMELVTGRYPWATNDATSYVTAYRYFVNRCRSIAPNASYIWSPAGNRELSAYWPGGAYVDVIGLSMYSYAAWEIGYYGYVRTFEQAFGERYDFVKGFGKPIMITEFGAIGTDKAQWLTNAMAALPHFPLLSGVVFFSAQDPAPWGANYPAPDWRLPAWAFDIRPPPNVAQ